MALALCCEFRTGVLFLGFLLGTGEVGLAVMFYTFKEDFRRKVGYEVRFFCKLKPVLHGIGP